MNRVRACRISQFQMLALAFVWLSLSDAHGQEAVEKKAEKPAAAALPENPFPGRRPKAPPLEGGLGWLNSAGPIELAKLKGKVVLLDFWTYCCINCMHVLPDLSKLEKAFPNELVVIGVHSAKFETEKDSGNIREAILRYDIRHPVINDGEMAIWRMYGVRSWPTMVLIDPEGFYIGRLSGEGNFETLHEVIRRLVAYHLAKGTLDPRPVHFQLESSGTESTPLRFPGKVAVDAKAGRIYVSDSSHNRIVVADHKSGTVQHVVGDGQAELKDGSFAEARFNDPQGLAPDGDRLYVADTKNHALRLVDFSKKSVTTLAGTGERGFERRAARTPRQISLASPWDLLLMNRRLFIAMAGSHQIWLYDLASSQLQVFAGSGIENLSDDNRANAEFAQPSGLATDGTWLYVADSEVSAVRKVGLEKDVVETLVGVGLFEFGDEDGVGDRARLQHCLGIAWHDGKLFIADSYNNKIKTLDPKTRRTKTFLGDGKPGAGADPVRFDEPGGLAIADGVLYVADTNNHAIRRIDLATRQTSDLALTGLTPPARMAQPVDLPADRTIDHPPIVLKSNQTLRVAGVVPIPKGQKLNPASPMSYRIEKISKDAKSQLLSRGPIRPVRPDFSIRLDNMDLADATAVQVAVVFYPCEEGSEGLCRVRTLVWNVPISIDPKTGVEEIKLPDGG